MSGAFDGPRGPTGPSGGTGTWGLPLPASDKRPWPESFEHLKKVMRANDPPRVPVLTAAQRAQADEYAAAFDLPSEDYRPNLMPFPGGTQTYSGNILAQGR